MKAILTLDIEDFTTLLQNLPTQYRRAKLLNRAEFKWEGGDEDGLYEETINKLSDIVNSGG